MKTRTSFVSNSSSSSFLVVYGRPEDFGELAEKHNPLMEELLKDLARIKSRADVGGSAERIAKFLCARIWSETKECFDGLVDEFRPGRRRYSVIDCSNPHGKERFSKIVELIRDASGGAVDGAEVGEAFRKMKAEICRDFEDCEARRPGFIDDNGEFDAIWDRCLNDRTERLFNGAELVEFARGIAGRWPSADVVGYADDYDFGATMEHEFLPGLASGNGREKWLVFRNSEH